MSVQLSELAPHHGGIAGISDIGLIACRELVTDCIAAHTVVALKFVDEQVVNRHRRADHLSAAAECRQHGETRLQYVPLDGERIDQLEHDSFSVRLGEVDAALMAAAEFAQVAEPEFRVDVSRKCTRLDDFLDSHCWRAPPREHEWGRKPKSRPVNELPSSVLPAATVAGVPRSVPGHVCPGGGAGRSGNRHSSGIRRPRAWSPRAATPAAGLRTGFPSRRGLTRRRLLGRSSCGRRRSRPRRRLGQVVVRRGSPDHGQHDVRVVDRGLVVGVVLGAHPGPAGRRLRRTGRRGRR